ncbi:uncharacterized protein MONBRDRAFT_9403 [Monosiga brevicollis MX1]|uniref:Uncharacterized protein n=1 Tax=Monosiga brevicollis TaxID=81824 RepID=A9V318_MONBE|nr:uncharacterized protein MONBRDRAFT_9403 [Monosiga brevicollis MX1]EDQ87985.1 predicted protein [Monosiga brevicollis MX1]|eukprot:XP_001747061.1 hypothetical protein [Monosiga brevicollis MX1]
MPTLVELCGLAPIPACQASSYHQSICTEGQSLVPLLRNPEDTANRTAAYSQYAFCMHDDMIWHDACDAEVEPQVMGYAIRTHRIALWAKHDLLQVLGQELYDHTEADSVENEAESVNLVHQYPAVVASLHAQLVHFFDGNDAIS